MRHSLVTDRQTDGRTDEQRSYSNIYYDADHNMVNLVEGNQSQFRY